ncbi:MAG TPA: hypothetical protein VF677_03780, partial [Flavobacterium sp.]
METTQPSLNDDLDLIGLIKKLKNLIFKWKGFLRNALVIGILLGVVYFFITPKVYESKALVASEYVKGSSFIILIENIQRHLKEDNIEQVALSLNIDLETAKKMKGISAYTVQNFSQNQLSDKIGDNEEEEKENRSGEFVIEVYSSDNDIWPEIQKGLLYYIENNEFTKGRSYQKKVGLKLMKNRIHAELKQLDSLKYSVSALMSGKQGNYYIN